MERVFRFRSMSRLLGSGNIQGELESGNIYFAPPEQLNDPLEGNRAFQWSGDYIVWRNLFRHYVFCLWHSVNMMLIGGHQDLHEDSIIVGMSIDDFPPAGQDQIERSAKRLLANEVVSNLIDNICKRTTPIESDELECYLSAIHLLALNYITDVLIQDKLVSHLSTFGSDLIEAVEKSVSTKCGEIVLLETIISHSAPDPREIADYFREKTYALRNEKLNEKIGLMGYDFDRTKVFVVLDFPGLYVRSLKHVCFPKWHTACFMTSCDNAASWGYYGDGHRGVCMIFNPKLINAKHYLELETVCGMDRKGTIFNFQNHELRPVTYGHTRLPINYFTSMGVLPIKTINRMWYSDDEGRLSVCSDEILNDEENWRIRYWENYYKDLLVKTKDWGAEKEYRLILQKSSFDLSDGKRPLAKYKFESLEGLIFGINACPLNVTKVVEIIKAKCRTHGRSEFNFFQAVHDQQNDLISYKLLNIK